MRIVGDHIILRTVNSGDIDILFKWENNPDVSKFNVNNEVVSKEDLKRFINGPHDIYLDGQLRLMITLASNDEVIGTLDLFEYDKKKSSVGVGILIFQKEDRRKSYGSIAIDMSLRYIVSHLNIKKVFCNIEEENDSSISFFKSKGFVRLPENTSSNLLAHKLEGMDLYCFDCL